MGLFWVVGHANGYKNQERKREARVNHGQMSECGRIATYRGGMAHRRDRAPGFYFNNKLN